MTDRPILFSAPMVRALLAGRKTQTRRLIYRDKFGTGSMKMGPGSNPISVPTSRTTATLIQPGDRLWVRHSANLLPVYFRPIAGWEDRYAAGTDGLIYRIDRGEPEPLQGSPTSKGYLSVSLSRGSWHTRNVHRLVCETYYGPAPSDKHQVQHLDGNMINNRPENLDWGTASDAWALRKFMRRGVGISHHSAKLSISAAEEIRSSSLSQRALAKRYGVRQSTIHDVLSGKIWAPPEVPRRNMEPFRLWRSGIHMPRWASRITLHVEAVKVERLHSITPADAIAEGISPAANSQTIDCDTPNPVDRFRSLWESINGAGSWAEDPWVAAISFRTVLANIDAAEARVG